MGGSWIEEKFEDYKVQLSSKQQCLTAWELIELVGMGHFSKGMDRQTLSMGINEVFQELILDMLKQVSETQLWLLYFTLFCSGTLEVLSRWNIGVEKLNITRLAC